MNDESNSADGEVRSDGPTARMLTWARNSTMYRLSRQMMTEKQLADAIRKKARTKFEDISETQLDALAKTAVQFGYDMKALDDAAYAEITVRSGMRGGKSKRLIAQKLVQKGIARETASAAVEETDDLSAAVAFARKRAFGPFRKAELDEARKAKELSAFARQGFSFEIGKKVAFLDLEEAEEILYGAAR
jgi:regulatory protein